MTATLRPGEYRDWLDRTMPPEKAVIASAFLLSVECTVSGEASAIGGGRIAPVLLAEGEGVTGCQSIEDVRDAIARVSSAENLYYPHDLAERSTRVAAIFGFSAEARP